MIICQPLVETPAQHEPFNVCAWVRKLVQISPKILFHQKMHFTKERRAPSSSVEWES
jgi:hypothetical protein